MKNGFLKFCFIVNIICIPYFLIPFFVLIWDVDLYRDVIKIVFKGSIGLAITYFLGIFSLILWINNLKFWNTKDKNSTHFFLLLFFSLIYSPIYYYKYSSRS